MTSFANVTLNKPTKEAPAGKLYKETRKRNNRNAGQERKTARAAYLIRPTVKADIKKLAAVDQTTINDLIGQIIDGYELPAGAAGVLQYSNEAKSDRVNLVLRASTKERLADLAATAGTTSNDMVNRILEDYAADHKADLKAYNDFFGKRG